MWAPLKPLLLEMHSSREIFQRTLSNSTQCDCCSRLVTWPHCVSHNCLCVPLAMRYSCKHAVCTTAAGFSSESPEVLTWSCLTARESVCLFLRRNKDSFWLSSNQWHWRNFKRHLVKKKCVQCIVSVHHRVCLKRQQKKVTKQNILKNHFKISIFVSNLFPPKIVTTLYVFPS